MVAGKLRLTFKKIKSISKVSHEAKVYNLKCKPYSNFFPNFILVHNCDTILSTAGVRYCKVEELKKKGFIKIKNPLSCGKLFEIIKKFNEKIGPYHSVSLTGGEPLLQNDFLKEFLPLVRRIGLKIYLETNGTMPAALTEVIDDVDIIAMDFKLPSSTRQMDFWPTHKRFLKIASKKDLFVKAVVCRSTELDDIKQSVRLLVDFNNIPFVLQPNFAEMNKQLIMKVRNFQKFCLSYLSDVRIIPQMHKRMEMK